MSATELSFFARTKGLQRGDLERQLWTAKSLARTWCMRGTLHVIPAAEAAFFMVACRRDEHGYNPAWLRYFNLAPDDMTAVIGAIGEVLADGRVRTRKELVAEVEARIGSRFHEQLQSAWGSFLKPAAGRGLLICGPPRGQEVTFVHAGAWLGRWEPPSAEDARVELVRRYLHSYGPATRADFERWAGQLPPQARPSWTGALPGMVEVEVEGIKLWTLSEDADLTAACEPSEEVRLVPNFDSYLLSHARRAAMVSKEHASRIYRPAAWTWATVLKGGRAVATWNSKRTGKRFAVEIEPFAPLSRKDRRAVGEEVDAMAEFLGLRADVAYA
jgi:hypothetical protein